VEELIGDVGENGSATRRDAALGDKNEKAREELTKVDNGGAFGEFGEESAERSAESSGNDTRTASPFIRKWREQRPE
jgi:hypothetical protein